MPVLALTRAFGAILLFMAAAKLLPLAFALAASDAASALGFGCGAACGVFLGVMLILAGRGHPWRPERRDVLIFVVAGWVLVGLFGALPLALAGTPAHFSDAVVEAISGVTASGLSTIESLDTAPRSIILWRALLQWMGGYATLLFAAVVAPRLALTAPTAPTRESYVPRARHMARTAGVIYGALTVAAAAALAAAGASPFDAVCYAMSSVSTGGFATSDAGASALNGPARVILVVAMTAGALNMLAIWRSGAGRALTGDIELRLLLILAAGGGAAITIAADESAFNALFAAVSALTTTGFDAGLAPYSPAFTILVLALLALIGGAGSSTAGGIKLARALLLYRQCVQELARLAHPHRVVRTKIGGISVGDQVLRGIWAYFAVFLLSLGLLSLLLAMFGLNFREASVLALSLLTNSGPLLAETAEAPHLATFSWPGDILIAAALLVGRLELFALLVLLTPVFWRR